MNTKFDAWSIPDGMSLQEFVNSRIARFSTQRYDFTASKFQADFAAKYQQTQMHCIATGSRGVGGDTTRIASDKFCFSTSVLLAQTQQAFYAHQDVEEVLFVLRGCIDLTIEYHGEQYATQLNERDLISIPPMVYRRLFNPGLEDAILCVMLGHEPASTYTSGTDFGSSKFEIY